MIGTINSLNSLNPLKINLNAVRETQPDDNNELAGKSFQELLDGAVNDVPHVLEPLYTAIPAPEGQVIPPAAVASAFI